MQQCPSELSLGFSVEEIKAAVAHSSVGCDGFHGAPAGSGFFRGFRVLTKTALYIFLTFPSVVASGTTESEC